MYRDMRSSLLVQCDPAGSYLRPPKSTFRLLAAMLMVHYHALY